jgi:hypothetical protein
MFDRYLAKRVIGRSRQVGLLAASQPRCSPMLVAVAFDLLQFMFQFLPGEPLTKPP